MTRIGMGWGMGATFGVVLLATGCSDDGSRASATEPGTSTVATTGSGTTSTTSSTTGEPTTGTPTTGTPTTDTATSSTGEPAGVCGDGEVDVGEDCDDGADNGPGKACKADCKANTCGDGDVGPGEGCDDGNAVDDDECSNACKQISCGDGAVAASEQCDDGNADNTDACTDTCTTAVCGDGQIWSTAGGTEVCDDGEDNDPANACKDDCTLNVCGDGAAGPGEGCDDGNIEAGDGCSPTCKMESCGSGEKDPGEDCDDGMNGDQDDGCTDLCLLPECGDGFEQASLMEECDLGMMNSDTGACTLACKDAVCGDKLLGPGEECDDGNKVNGDGCTDACKLQIFATCKAIKLANPAAKDGVFKIDPDGVGPKVAYDVFCEMTTDGGGWQVMNYLRKPAHWDIPIFTDSGVVGDIVGGFSSGKTLQTGNDNFKERIIIYLKLIENGQNLGKQWMVSDRGVAIPFASINTTPNGWGYRDSFLYADPTVGNVCTHGCTTYRGFGMFHDFENGFGWCGTQTGDFGCRDGNNICWMPRSLGCNVGSARCAYLIENGEGVIYAAR